MFIFDPSHVVLTSWNQGKLHCVTSKKVTVQRVKYCYVFYQTGRRLGKKSSCTHSQLSTPKTAGDSPLSSCSFKKKIFWGHFPISRVFHSIFCTSLSFCAFFCSRWLWYDISVLADSLEHHRETTRELKKYADNCQNIARFFQNPASQRQSGEVHTDACDLYSVSSRTALEIHFATESSVLFLAPEVVYTVINNR